MSGAVEAVLETTAGKVRGAEREGIRSFLGVPYGGDTGGANRFKAPSPATPWAGVREATSYGPSSWQPSGPGAGDALKMFGGIAEPSMGEDCLVLNVWAPAGAADLPVLVWFHGGGHTSGSGSWPAYDGAALARRGEAVVVTVNHRLGLLGYLYLGDLAGEEYATSGANGILDLVAVLEWVRDNIAGFGGDPARVLAYGESGGGWKTSTLLATPSAAGLFQRASLMSGAGLKCPTTDDATALAERTLAHLGITADRIAEIHDVPAERLMEAQMAVGMGFAPVMDGTHIAAHPLEAVRAGTAHDVPMLIGTCRDEFATFFMGNPLPSEPVDDMWLTERLRPTLGENTDKLVSGYREARPGADPVELEIAIATDNHMRVPSIRMAETCAARGTSPVFMYRFDWETPAMDGRLKAGHGVDYPFFFHNLNSAIVSSAGPGRERLAGQMSDALLAFARHGDPNHDALPAWSAYEPSNRSTMLFGTESHAVDDPNGTERVLWDGIV